MQARRKQARGVALIEFVLVAPLLILLSLTVVEYGRAIYYYNTLAKSVRDAARYVSTHTPGSHIDETRNIVRFGNPAGGTQARVPGLDATNVPAPVWGSAGAGPMINTVTVRVTGYTFQPMFAAPFGPAFAAIPFNDISATMRSPN